MKRELLAALIFAFLLTGLNIAGLFHTGSLTWGFHFLGYLPDYFTVLYLLLLFAALAFIFTRKPAGYLSKAAGFMAGRPIIFLASVLTIFIISGVFFRVKAPLLGDGFFLVRNFSETLQDISPLLYRNEPLSTYYYFAVMKLTGVSTYAGFLNSFLVADLIMGACFVVNLFFITKYLFDTNEDRLLSFLFLLAIPYVELFCGYVETYAVALFSVSLFVLASVLYLKKGIPFLAVTLIFLFMALTHYLTLLLLPCLIYLSYLEITSRGYNGVIKSAGVSALIIFLLLLAVNFEVANFSASVPHSHFLSLSPSSDRAERYSEAYTLFSPLHLSDIINFIILLCSSSLFLILLTAFRGKGIILRSSESKLLAAGAISALAFLIAVKFDLGAAKDWDVLSPYALLPALLGVFVFLSAKSAYGVKIVMLLTTVTILNTSVYLYLNSRTDASVRRYLSLLDRRTMSQMSFYSASLHLALYYHQEHDPRGPLVLWDRYISTFPNDTMGYQNLIRNLKNLGPESSVDIARTYQRWCDSNPQDTSADFQYARFCLESGNSCFARGSLREAESHYQKAISLDPLYARAYNNLGSVYAQQDSIRKAIKCFQKAVDIDGEYSDPYYNMANAYEDLGDRKKSLEMLRQAALLGNQTAQNKLGQTLK